MRPDTAKRLQCCTQLRRMLMRHATLNMATGERAECGEEWVTEACGTPLFSEAERSTGVCSSCASGWSSPTSMPATEAPLTTGDEAAAADRAARELEA